MAATAMLANATSSATPRARTTDTHATADADAGSFAEAMDEQSTSDVAGCTATRGEPRSESAAARSVRDDGDARQRTTAARDADTTADADRTGPTAPVEDGVEDLLGLCAAQATGMEGDAPLEDTALADTETAAGSMAPPATLPALPAVALPEAQAVAREPALDADPLELLGGLRAARGVGGSSVDAALAQRLETALDGPRVERNTDERGAGAPTAPPGDVRGPSRNVDAAPVPARPPELRSPPGTPAWTDELGTHVTWMLDQGEQVASLSLSPEDLGPLDVRIAVREGETSIWFGAAHPDTRAALEQSLPRLREMLGASGLALANAGVFSQTPRDPQRGFTAAALARAAAEAGGEAATVNVTSVTRRGLVDLYA